LNKLLSTRRKRDEIRTSRSRRDSRPGDRGFGCGNERSAKADTGTATATVATDAPPSAVPDAQLQQQAQQAATAASTPVDGSGPVTTTTAVAPTAPAKK
jgi:hypothetical protein